MGSGGAITHIVSFLNECKKKDKCEFIVWGKNNLLSKIENKDYIKKISIDKYSKNFLLRIYFQTFQLSKEARMKNCDILFLPGGTFLGTFRPFVTMCRNMLPYEVKERNRYKFRLRIIKLLILKVIQLATFKRANGIIFLTKYARDRIKNFIPDINQKSVIIPHGINKLYFSETRINKKVKKNKGMICTYTSTIDFYKHQNKIITAINNLNKNKFDIKLNLIGTAYKPAKKNLLMQLNKIDPKNNFITYHGSLNSLQIKKLYSKSDFLIFASSCENLPNILLEKMATGLPIACSRKRPMTDILEKNGVYFDYNSISDIENCIIRLVNMIGKNDYSSKEVTNRAKKYTWSKCKTETINYLGSFK